MPNRPRWTAEARERINVRVLMVMREMLAEGVDPTIRALRARIDVGKDVIDRARMEVVSSGQIAYEIKGTTRGMQTGEERARLKRRLLGFLRDHAAGGDHPSIRELALLFADERPRPHVGLIRVLRDELRDAGLYHLPPRRGAVPRGVAGLDGATDASKAEIRANWLEIQAQKEARGEPYVLPNPPAEVLRSRDYRLRENRR